MRGVPLRGLIAVIMLFSLEHAPTVGAASPTVATAGASPAGADCAKPPRAPVMPQGATATDEEMKAGHDSLQKYVLILESYQSCMEQRVKTAPADTKPEIRQQWQALADSAIDAAHEIADVYSIQLRAFKARQ